MDAEGLTTEYKSEYTEDIKKTVIAFANTKGGNIYIGISDDGKITGVDNPDEIILKAGNSIRDSIKPDITMHVEYETRQIEDKNIIIIHVEKGSSSPYYLSIKGIRPEGVFVRQGASTAPASDSHIIKMIKENASDEFEATKSIMQDLSFNEAMRYFTERKVEFKEEQKRSLGIKNSDGLYTNLGLIFSDQCIHTIKLAIFQGINKLTFKDRKEFSGSILRQIDDVFKYIELFNRIRSEFSGLDRIDIPDYPVEAVREALLNAITHRDYSYSSSTLISLFDDRIEFVSLGGLPKGITYNDMMLGISVLRNSRICDIFYRLHLIEAYGTGIQKIMESYDDFYIKPKIEVSDNAFKITLPNINYTHEFIIKENAISYNEQKVLDYLKDKYYSTRKEIENYSGLSQATTVRILASLLEKGLIIRQGEGKSTTYSKGF